MTYDTESGAHAAERLLRCRFAVVGEHTEARGIFLEVESRQTALAAEILHGSFRIRSQNDVLRPKYQPDSKQTQQLGLKLGQLNCRFTLNVFWSHSLLAVVADLAVDSTGGQRRGEAGGGAEERRIALLLESRLSFCQGLFTVGAVHERRRGVDDGQALSVCSWRDRVHRANPQILLSITAIRSVEIQLF